MIGYVFSIEVINDDTTKVGKVNWHGITPDFKLDVNGLYIGVSELYLKDYSGKADDLIALLLVDDYGRIKADDRAGGSPAFYYGVVTAVSDDKVMCSDARLYYLNCDYVKEPKNSNIKNPITYLQTICKSWIVGSHISIDMTEDVSFSFTGQTYKAPNPEDPDTENITETVFEYLQSYGVSLVISKDTMKDDRLGNEFVGTFICGSPIGTFIIDDSEMVKEPSVYVRPVMDGEPNGIAICRPNPGNKYKTLTVVRRYITKDSKIVSSSSDPNIVKPIKMKTYISTDNETRTEAQIRKELNSKKSELSKQQAAYSKETDASKKETMKSKIDMLKDEVKRLEEDLAEKVALQDWNAIAQENLEVPSYSHEITFKVNKDMNRINELMQIGNTLNIIHNQKSYTSIVTGYEVDSTSDYVLIKCGNVGSKLSSILAKGTKTKYSKTKANQTIGTVSTDEIDTIIAKYFN